MAKDAKKPSWFKMFLHQKAIIDSVDDATAGKALKAAFQYFDTGESVDMDQAVFIVFSAIKPYIDESYLDFQRSSAAGKKGMESRWGNRDNPLKDPLSLLDNHRPPQTPNNEAEADAETDTEVDADVYKADKPSKRTRFTPPTVDEVRAYCQESGYNVIPERFVDHYASNGWMVGKNKMKDWKATVRNWSRGNDEKQSPSRPKHPPIPGVPTL